MSGLRRGGVGPVVVGAALVVVLAVVGGALAAHAMLAMGATPPDAVRVVVSEDSSLAYEAYIGYVRLAHSVHTIRFQRTITDLLTVRSLRTLVNEPADGKMPLPTCAVGSPAATTPAMPAYIGTDTYDFTFTAHGTPVEHAVISFRCDGAAVRRGWAPFLALSDERGLGPNWWQIFPATIWPVGGPYTQTLRIPTPRPNRAR